MPMYIRLYKTPAEALLRGRHGGQLQLRRVRGRSLHGLGHGPGGCEVQGADGDKRRIGGCGVVGEEGMGTCAGDCR